MDETTNSPRSCSRCGKPLAADAPQGLCAACLLLAGTETITQSAGDAPTLWGGDDPGSESPRLTPGQSWGSYRIGRLLGRGGMGEVYEAEHTKTGRRLALKVLRSRLQSPEERSRFLREGQMAASVSHPHTVYIFGSEEISDTPVISMELAPGGTLKDRVATGGPFAPTEAVSAILDIIGGLDAAQAAGILHRDIKPSNCFVDGDGAVKVGDFGLSISTLARDVHQDVAARRFQGTPQFAAPEQLRGEPLDMRADIYAVGATLYYLLTGQPPFDARNWRDLVERVTAETPQSPRLLRRDVPSGLASVVLMCLSKDPSRRPASYAALAGALRPFSSAGYAPARLGVRFVAGIVDSLILTIVVPILTWLAGNPFIGEQTAEIALWTGVPLLAYFLFEGHWGGTPGKLLFGLRVRSVEGGVASWAQIFWRHLMFDAPSLLLMLPVPIVGAARMNAYFLRNPGMALAIGVGSTAVMWAYFLTARRHNGWAAVHDLLSKTRLVVVRRAEHQRSHAGSQTAAFSEDDAMPGTPQYGPFTVISESVDLGNGRFLLGFDPALRRRVWIRTVLAGTPTISEARRDISRRGRLHWLTGRRSTEENWDAYEAPDGSPFLSHQAPTPWPTMRIWLTDLANELWSARRDGTLPRLNLNRIWIRNNGHLLLLDFPADMAASPATAARSAEDHQEFTPVQLLSSVAERNLSRDMSDRDPVPPTARSMIHKWSGSTPIEDARASLLHLSSSVDRVTSWRRAMPIALAALPFVLVIGLIVGVVPALEQIWTPERWEVLTLLTELSGGASLQPRLADPEYRLAVERYLAGRHSAFLRDDAFWEMLPGFMEPRRALALDIAVRHPSVSPDELARAEALISPQLEEWRKLRVEDPAALDFGFMGALAALVVVVWSVISSVLVPGGLVTRALGLAVVTRHGEEIRRWRSVARVLIAWSSAIVWIAWSLASAPLFAPELDAPLGLTSWFGMGLAFLPLIAGSVWAIVHPTRGIHDRLAGTWVVPR